MEWAEEAIVLAARRHGESDAIAAVLTHGHGRCAGLVRGGAGRRHGPAFQPGNRIAARWRARLESQLGTLSGELVHAAAARFLDDPDRLAALAAAAAVADLALPEREPHPLAFEGLSALLAALEAGEGWQARYVRWEVDLLAELGFGLDLWSCAATGVTEDLIHVSPRSGRAVSRAAGAPYAGRLLPLPGFLRGEGEATPSAVADGLRLTGHFLDAHVFQAIGRPIPEARLRLVDRLARASTMGGSRTPEPPQNLRDA